MTLEPTSMASTFEDVIVQNWPARPAFCEHSFVTKRSPVRGEDAANADADILALGLVGTPDPSAHPPAASAPAQRHPITTNFIHPPLALPPFFLLPPMPDARCPESVAY